ncbi:MAG: glycosyltransferase family 4 protein [Gammaproteobacteria bacterium]|nr:glycosyltransferase family 4 protein [Gammaproteobacteria bacterium]
MKAANTSTLYFAFPGNLDTPTGGYHYDRRLIGELRKTGTEVHTLSLPDRFPYADQQAREITRQILGAVPDDAVVVIDGLAFGVLDDLAAAEAERLRLIALCHHPLALESGLEDGHKQAFMASEKRALRHARGVIVTSRHTGQLLTTEFGVPQDLITVALPGVDRVPFAPCDGAPLRLLTVGSLIRRKAHDQLINALGRLKNLSWSARFIGESKFDPGWANSLEDRVADLQLRDRIFFTGPLDDLHGEYQNADIFVLPSRYEGYGMVFAEALAAGLPVIATHAGAVPDVVPASAGLLVPADDTEALTEALRVLLTEPEKRRQLQAGARSAAAKLPNWDDCAQCVAQKIEELRRL